MTTTDRPPLTPAERADLRQKASEATPGEWRAMVSPMARGGTRSYVQGDFLVCPAEPHDAAYIAAVSPERLLALLDEVERLQDENAGLRLQRPNGGTSND